MFDKFTPPHSEDLRTKTEKEKIANEARNQLMDGLLQMMIDHCDDEKRKTEMLLLLTASKVHHAANEIARFADPQAENVSAEDSAAALEVVENALSVLTAFLESHPKPGKTIFD